MEQKRRESPDLFGSQIGLMSVAVLVLLLLLSAVVLSLAAMAMTETKIAASQREGAAAQYLAEAAVKHAVVRLEHNRDFLGETLNDDPYLLNPDYGANSSCTTMVATGGDAYGRTITATATVGNATRTVVLHVVMPHSGAADTTSFQKALLAGGWLMLLGGATVDGDIHANGQWPFYWWAAVHGAVTGPPAHIPFPATDAADYRTQATIRDDRTVDLDGDQSRQLRAGDMWFIDGDLVMRRGSRLSVAGSGPVTVFVNGGVWLDRASLPDNMMLIATDSIVMTGTSVNRGIILSQNMTFVYGSPWQQVNIDGMVLGRSFVGVFDNVHVTYDNTMLQDPQHLPPGFPTGAAVPFTILSWSNAK